MLSGRGCQCACLPRLSSSAFFLSVFLRPRRLAERVCHREGSHDRQGRGQEFIPAPEQQVTIDRKGALSASESSGEYILTVEVTMDDKTTKKPYDVWVDKRRYEAVKIGDAFDVGPYLVRE